jgi:hypothetical protein
MVKVKAPKRVKLTKRQPTRTVKIRFIIQNRSPTAETIPDADTLEKLVTSELTSIVPGSLCAAPAVKLVPGKLLKKLPITLKPKKKLKLTFLATFNCATDPAKSTKKDPGHEDFELTGSVDRSVIDGKADIHPQDDGCPRSVTPPYEIDPFPDGTIKDKGCGAKKADGTFGDPVLIDVFVK